MNRHTAPAGDKSRDRLARKRIAAARKSYQHVTDARHHDRTCGGFARAAILGPWLRGGGQLRFAVDLEFLGREQFREQLARSHQTISHRGDEAIDVLLRKVLQHRLEPLRATQLGDAEPERRELMIDERYAESQRAFSFLRPQPLADT